MKEFSVLFCKYWVSWAQKADFDPSLKRASHFVKIIVACPHHLPKLPESTQRKQAIPNKGSLFYSHCGFIITRRLGQQCHYEVPRAVPGPGRDKSVPGPGTNKKCTLPGPAPVQTKTYPGKMCSSPNSQRLRDTEQIKLQHDATVECVKLFIIFSMATITKSIG
jgi:hypothetical protein